MIYESHRDGGASPSASSSSSSGMCHSEESESESVITQETTISHRDPQLRSETQEFEPAGDAICAPGVQQQMQPCERNTHQDTSCTNESCIASACQEYYQREHKPSGCLTVCLFVGRYVWRSVCRSICPFIHTSVCLFVRLSVGLPLSVARRGEGSNAYSESANEMVFFSDADVVYFHSIIIKYNIDI